ncbi:hypothetical protein [Flavobacterium sp.]|jgi:hypothetical protein|uniref:hypothetical protein n=1 Tax=Flavobacterium sp. TaxID=239 RepID=UPI0037C11C47
MTTPERAAVLLQYEQLAQQFDDLHHPHNTGIGRKGLQKQRIDTGMRLFRIRKEHRITVQEMTEFKRRGRPVCSTVAQAMTQMCRFFGVQQ